MQKQKLQTQGFAMSVLGGKVMSIRKRLSLIPLIFEHLDATWDREMAHVRATSK
jgi:hypothetical protein